MSLYTLAVLNLLIGLCYSGYGVLTVIELKRGWRTLGYSPFGVAWVFMAFTCGPHHLVHSLSMFAGSSAHHGASMGSGPVEVVAVVVGLPAAATWLYLRIEAVAGGRGDRFIPGTPRWMGVMPALTVVYAVGFCVALLAVATQGEGLTPRLVPNLLLVGTYGLTGFYLFRTQLTNRPVLGGWSLSGLALSVVFPTCGLMHASVLAYAVAGDYHVNGLLLLVDWLAVMSSVYFLHVVRGLYVGSVTDWNRSTTGVARKTAVA